MMEQPSQTELEQQQDAFEPSTKPQPPHRPESPIPFYQRNPVTSLFSALLVAIYLLTSFHTNFKKLEPWAFYVGSFYGPAVQAGQWWRFITATLLHDNPMHLFSNVFGILAFGGMIEPILGTQRLLTLYVFSFVAGLLLSWLMNPFAVTLGVSTIDYGLIGAYLSMALLLRYQTNRKIFFQELRGALMFILIFTIWNAMESEHINIWAHLGGLSAGVVFIACIWPRKQLN